MSESFRDYAVTKVWNQTHLLLSFLGVDFNAHTSTVNGFFVSRSSVPGLVVDSLLVER